MENHNKAAPIPHEKHEAVALFHWVKLMENARPELKLFFHIANGEARDQLTGAKLKRMGVRAGMVDYMLPVARGRYHGLAIELKRRNGGSVSPSQKSCIDRLNAQGYYAAVCKGAESAIRVIQDYLTMGEFCDKK